MAAQLGAQRPMPLVQLLAIESLFAGPQPLQLPPRPANPPTSLRCCLPCPAQVCNCNCLPILPVERPGSACCPCAGPALHDNNAAGAECGTPHSVDSGDEECAAVSMGFEPNH